MKYAVDVFAKYMMYVEAKSEEEAVKKAEDAMVFLEEDYPEEDGAVTEIEIVYAYGEVEK